MTTVNHPNYPSWSGSAGTGTYEATKAAERVRVQPDPIHWHDSTAFRDSSYRQLHHQRNGTVGVFAVRLLQAHNLQRSHWSPLALGPVKHLGLSKAHGAVSSFCTFRLDFTSSSTTTTTSSTGSSSSRGAPQNPTRDDKLFLSESVRGMSRGQSMMDAQQHSSNQDWTDRKPAAKPSQRNAASSATSTFNSKNSPCFVSPVIPNDNNPVWDSCALEFALKKGACHPDGSRILLRVNVEEEGTAVEQFLLPGLPTSNNNNNNSRLLGSGVLDLTELCLGETPSGNPLPGVRDAWITLTLPNNNSNDPDSHSEDRSTAAAEGGEKFASAAASVPDFSKDKDPLAQPPSSSSSSSASVSSKSTGQVRVLVSYQPFGMEPQAKDIVALEAFARCHVASASCRPVLDPLMPFTIMDRRGSYLLASYLLPDGRRSACVRLHRNAVFVIERQNVWDAATNLALLPVDVARSTPLGQAVQDALTPVATAGRELLMPALLSAKLIWMAVRTTGLGVASGVWALTGTVWHEGATSLTRGDSNGNGMAASRGREGRSTAGTAQFVQL